MSIDLDNKLVVGDIAGNPIISRSLVLFYILLKLFLFTSSNFRISFIRNQTSNVTHLLARATSYVNLCHAQISISLQNTGFCITRNIVIFTEMN